MTWTCSAGLAWARRAWMSSASCRASESPPRRDGARSLPSYRSMVATRARVQAPACRQTRTHSRATSAPPARRSLAWTLPPIASSPSSAELIVSKGVDLLLAAWPLVLEGVPAARLVVVGFGAYREGFERLRAALAAADIEQAKEIARAGRSLEDRSAGAQPLVHLLAFLDELHGDARSTISPPRPRWEIASC